MEDANGHRDELAQLIDRLATTLGRRRYETWFESQTEFRVAAGGELQVLVSSPLQRDCLQRQFSAEVREAYAEVAGGERPVSFRIRPEDEAEQYGAEPTRDRRRPAARQRRPAPAPVGPLGDPAPAPIDELVVGEANYDAVQIAKQLAGGVFVASPLVLWGGTGVGKTRLLRAIHDQVRRTRRVRSVCLTAEEFLSGFVEAVHDRGLPAFRSKNRGVDLLLLDDVQMLLGKRRTLEELQYTLDALVAAGSQVVLASDRGPAELTQLGGELASRLAAGVAVELRTPEPAMRRELLLRLCDERGVQVEPAAADAISKGLVGGPRELSGVVNRLRYETHLFGDAADEPLARRVVADVNRQSTPRVRLADVEHAVCKVFGVEAAVLKSNKRTKAASEPRMLAMWLARKYTRSAWSEIGDFFGKRRHSTVISACRRVDKLLDGSAAVRVGGDACDAQEALRRVESELRTR